MLAKNYGKAKVQIKDSNGKWIKLKDAMCKVIKPSIFFKIRMKLSYIWNCYFRKNVVNCKLDYYDDKIINKILEERNK